MDIVSIYNNADSLLLWVLFIVFIVVLARELCLWYWRINRIIELLENIEKNTNKDNANIPESKLEKDNVDLLKTTLFK